MDFTSFLGGLTLGAAGAALLEYANQQKLLGQGVVTGGGPGGGFGGPSYGPGGFGPGVVQGPGGDGFGGPGGPAVINMVDGDGDEVGPIVSVPPIVHDGDRFIVGDSFFGVSASPWFWPLNVFQIFQWPPLPQTIVCKKIEEENDQEVFECRRKYPVQSVAWGPPAGWM